jgi:hypothetical protein
MPSTTIKVDVAVRDRLANVARARGISVSTLLRDESYRLAAEQRWRDIEAAYARLQREDPDGWGEYLVELDETDIGADLGDAAAEWPEYDR